MLIWEWGCHIVWYTATTSQDVIKKCEKEEKYSLGTLCYYYKCPGNNLRVARLISCLRKRWTATVAKIGLVSQVFTQRSWIWKVNSKRVFKCDFNTSHIDSSSLMLSKYPLHPMLLVMPVLSHTCVKISSPWHP